MLIKLFLFAFLLALGGSARLVAHGSTPQKYPTDVIKKRPTARMPGDPDDPQDSRHNEMLKEMALKREQNDYKEHLSRAKENAQLAVELQEAFAHQKTLQEVDLKKLSRMEKLARQIRNKAGGEENKEELKEVPPQVEVALERLVKLSSDLQKKVESTPRQVVSAAVIKRANEVVELVKHLRTLYR
ncbi:MAG TPA: hypothetical protein VGW12_02080 [Pyrinomonadaceae bacterium]|nr:hypothetical protein [Pyrinomonadaceae bacterium]